MIGKLVKIIEDERITKAELANRIGIDRSTLSNYLSNKIGKVGRDTENKIIAYLESNYKSDNKIKIVNRDFFETVDAVKVLTICKECQENRQLGSIVGKSGFGKTTVLKRYSKLKKVLYIKCTVAMRVRDLIEEIEDGLGLGGEKGSNLNKRLKNLEKFFDNITGYLIILDEADKFVNKDAVARMEIIRDIYDWGTVGVVIAGELSLEINIQKYIDRFANRIDLHHKMTGLSRDEVKVFLDGVDITEKAIEELIVRATNKRNGCFRLLDRTLKNVKRIHKNKEEQITLDTITEASSLMLL